MEFDSTPLRDSGKVSSMAPEDQQRQPDQEDRVAAELAALSARVESLERQLAELAHGLLRIEVRRAVALPPRPVPAAVSVGAPQTEHWKTDFAWIRGRSKTALGRRFSAGSGLWRCWWRRRCF